MTSGSVDGSVAGSLESGQGSGGLTTEAWLITLGVSTLLFLVTALTTPPDLVERIKTVLRDTFGVSL